MTETPESVIDAIRAAFARVRRGEISLHEAQVIDSYGGLAERRRARRRDVDGSWREVPDKSIVKCAWAMPHLDPKSWRYYLPAHMVWAIRHGHAGGLVVTDFTIYFLDLDDAGDEYKMERFRLLADAQSSAVCGFLRYMATTHECDTSAARRALRNYWGKFCASRRAARPPSRSRRRAPQRARA